MSPRTGRPPSENPRKYVRSVHLSADELAQVEAAAADAEQPVTVFIREAAVTAAERRARRRHR